MEADSTHKLLAELYSDSEESTEETSEEIIATETSIRLKNSNSVITFAIVLQIFMGKIQSFGIHVIGKFHMRAKYFPTRISRTVSNCSHGKLLSL